MVTHTDITKKFKMGAVKPEIHVSTFVHGISKLPYMIATLFQWHVFFVLGNTERPVGILSDV